MGAAAGKQDDGRAPARGVQSGAGAGAGKQLPIGEAAERLFAEADADKSGTLSMEEITAAAKKHAASIKADWTDERIQEVFKQIDINGDGALDVAEFTAGLSELMDYRRGGSASTGGRRGMRVGRRTILAQRAQGMEEHSRMLEEARHIAEAASASLEAVGAMPAREEEQLTAEQLERRKQEQLNVRVRRRPRRSRAHGGAP